MLISSFNRDRPIPMIYPERTIASFLDESISSID